MPAARAAEYSGAPGVGRAARRTGDEQDLTVTVVLHRGGRRLQEVIRGFETTRDHGGAVDATEAGQSGVNETLGALRLGEVVHSGHDLHRGAEGLQLGDEGVGGVAQDEVVRARREEAGERRADVELGVVDEGDAAARFTHGFTTSSAIGSGR